MISLNRRYQSKYFCLFPRTSITDFCYAGYILQWNEQKWTYMEDVWGQSLTWMYLFMLAKIKLGSFYVYLSDALHNFIDGLHLLFAIVELILKFETWSFLSPFFCLTQSFTKRYCQQIDEGIVTTGHHELTEYSPNRIYPLLFFHASWICRAWIFSISINRIFNFLFYFSNTLWCLRFT